MGLINRLMCKFKNAGYIIVLQKKYKMISINNRLKCCMRILFLFICAMSFASCSNQELNLDKFFSRLNARELNEASTYIHIGDHACLYFFAEMLGKSPDLFFELHSKQFISVDGKEAIVADIECVNMTPFFRNYMASLNILQDDGFIHDTIYVSKTAEGKKLSFRWANISGGNLKMASILDPDVSAMNIREHNSTNSRIIGKLSQGSSIVIDDYSNDPNWVRCYSLDHLCYKQEGFLYRPSLKIVNSDFFSLNLFESMGLLIAFIIFFALGILIVYGGSIVDAIVRGNGGCGGWILTSAMVIGILALMYVILEKILFELFVINLPY